MFANLVEYGNTIMMFNCIIIMSDYINMRISSHDCTCYTIIHRAINNKLILSFDHACCTLLDVSYSFDVCSINQSFSYTSKGTSDIVLQ